MEAEIDDKLPSRFRSFWHLRRSKLGECDTFGDKIAALRGWVAESFHLFSVLGLYFGVCLCVGVTLLHLGGDYNLFRYCHNDPINFTDPMGTEPPVAYSPRQMSQLIAEIREAPKQIAQLQAYVHAMEWSGHGAIAIGGASFQIGQLQSAVGNAMNALGLTRPQHSSANVANLAAIRRSTPTGVRVLPTGNGGSIVVVFWTIQLLDKQSKPTFGGGIWIDERIQHSNEIAFSPREKKYGGFWTKPHRVTLDTWTLPFRAPNGQVTTTQTLIVGGREATLRATVHANGVIEEGAEYWAPFH